MEKSAESIDKLKTLKVNHRNWRNAVAESFSLLTVVDPGDVVCITGPSRVGKTRLIKEVIQLLCGTIDFDKTGILPAVIVDADNTATNGTFSTKAFTIRMLEATRHPIFSYLDDRLGTSIDLQKIDRATESNLRGTLERALRLRKTRYLFIDEAQHARYVTKNAQGAYAVMDSWKCLARNANVVLVVVGAYPILEILRNSPHLLGRKNQIHLPRYHATQEDLSEFSRILLSYDPFVDLEPRFTSLLDQLELLYNGSFGCIGLLRKWLVKVSALARARGRQISVDLLKETREAHADMESIATEILNGERYLSTEEASLTSGRNGNSSSVSKKLGNNKQKPFQRNPKRYGPGNRTKGDPKGE
jgi:hypothetical protein